MKRIAPLLLWTCGVLTALGQPGLGTSPVPPTTPFTRYLLAATNQNDFSIRAGFGPTAVPTVPFLDPGMFNGQGLSVPQQISQGVSSIGAGLFDPLFSAFKLAAFSTNIVYVASWGNDANTGFATNAALATAWQASLVAQPGMTIEYLNSNSNDVANPHFVNFNPNIYHEFANGAVLYFTNFNGQIGGAIFNPGDQSVIHNAGLYLLGNPAQGTSALIGFGGKNGYTGQNSNSVHRIWSGTTRIWSQLQGPHWEGNGFAAQVQDTFEDLQMLYCDNAGIIVKVMGGNLRVRILAGSLNLTNIIGSHNGTSPERGFDWEPATGDSFELNNFRMDYADATTNTGNGVAVGFTGSSGGAGTVGSFKARNVTVVPHNTNGASFDVGNIGVLSANNAYDFDASVSEPNGAMLTETNNNVGQSQLNVFAANSRGTTWTGYGGNYWTNNTINAASYPSNSIVYGPTGPNWISNNVALPLAFGPYPTITYIAGLTSGNGTFAWSQNGNGSSNGTFTVTSIPSSTVQGSIAGTAAPSGIVGEQAVSNVTSGIAFSLSSGVALSITNLTLPAGNWLVLGSVNFYETSASVTARAAVFATTASLASGANVHLNAWDMAATTATTETNTIVLVPRIIDTATTVQYNLNVLAQFSAGSVNVCGTATAIRFY